MVGCGRQREGISPPKENLLHHLVNVFLKGEHVNHPQKNILTASETNWIQTAKMPGHQRDPGWGIPTFVTQRAPSVVAQGKETKYTCVCAPGRGVMGGNSNLPVVGLEELLPESLSVVSSLPRFKHPQAWDDPSSSLRSKGISPPPPPQMLFRLWTPCSRRENGGV